MKRILFGKKKEKTTQTKKRTSYQPSPVYMYAVQEYQQTVAPGSSNDNGKGLEQSYQSVPSAAAATPKAQKSLVETVTSDDGDDTEIGRATATSTNQKVIESPSLAGFQETNDEPGTNDHSSQQQSNKSFRIVDADSDVASVFKEPGQFHHAYYQMPESVMPDTTYEEQYGDAYVSAPLKYIYPSGYQSMRPRGGPWKLSVIVCILFTWLSIFTVSHCSDRIDNTQYQNNEIDDDALVIETRWCGSRLLYLMWVMSMLITGLSAAYCSIIGYIKVRDFAVANIRSQPPGMVGKSDFYVEITDSGRHSPSGQSTTLSVSSNPKYYQRSIYQADGTPQFWGGHIYRPTQAAVAVTSR